MFYKTEGNDILLYIRAVPNASFSKIGGIYNNRLKVYIDTQPENNKANKALIKLLSKHFKISKSNITIVQGEKSRDKVIRIHNSADIISILNQI